MSDIDKEALDRLTTGDLGEDFVRDIESRETPEESIEYTKGIIGAITQRPHLSVDDFDDYVNEVLDKKEFDKMMEQMFKYVKSTTPKKVMCGRCGIIVEVGLNNDCACGYIQEIVTILTKKEFNANI